MLLLAGSAVAVIGGIRHAWFGGATSAELWAGIGYLLSGGVLVLLPNTAKLSLGKDGIVVEQKVEDLQAQLDTAAGALRDLAATRATTLAATSVEPGAPSVESQLPQSYVQILKSNGIPIGNDLNDPLNAHQHPSSDDNYMLSATVDREPDQKNWFKSTLSVTSAEPADGIVTFFMHQSFPESVIEVPMRKGRAAKEIWSYGSFTVVAKVNNRSILELNLADLPGVPDAFRRN